MLTVRASTILKRHDCSENNKNNNNKKNSNFNLFLLLTLGIITTDDK